MFLWNGVIEEKGLIERRADRRKARLIHRAAIDLLVKDGFCETHEGELVCSLTSQQKAVDYDAFTEAAIQESKSYSDRQFLREVISIV